jgi:hypothetical protein
MLYGPSYAGNNPPDHHVSRGMFEMGIEDPDIEFWAGGQTLSSIFTLSATQAFSGCPGLFKQMKRRQPATYSAKPFTPNSARNTKLGKGSSIAFGSQILPR